MKRAVEELVRTASSKQSIVLGRHPEQGIVLFLDGVVQFAESTEDLYHEYLAVLPALFVRPRSVFIGGGGDGLAAARLLRFPEVREILICDHDRRLTDIARSHQDFRKLNRDSLNDPRVRIINRDAFAYLKQVKGPFDLIICDFPDPMTEAAERVFSREFYKIAREKLSPGGVIAIQATSLPRSFSLIRGTVQAVFPFLRSCRARYADGQTSHFVIAAKRPLRMIRRVPEWARALRASRRVEWLADRNKTSRSRRASPRGAASLARTTVLERYRDVASAPYPFDPRYWTVRLGPENPCPKPFLADFVRALAEEGPLVIYVSHPWRRAYGRLLSELGYVYRASYRTMEYAFDPANADRLEFWWGRLNNGSVVSIEARYCRPDEDPEIARLMERYMLEYGHRFLDLEFNRDVLGQRCLHLLARGRAGGIAVLMALDVRFNIEIVFGRGSSRSNVLGILLCLKYLQKTYGQTVTFQSATSNIVNFMIKLGGIERDRLDVFVPPSPLPHLSIECRKSLRNA